MVPLDIQLLGSMQLTRGEKTLRGFESNKARALLAYLVVEAARPHQRRRLAAMLWPEMPETTALSNLRYALSNLRKVIGDRSAQPHYLMITPQTIQFNIKSSYQVDVAVFERYCALAQDNPLDFESLRMSAELYKCHFLEGFSIPDSIPFEEWMLLKRERLDRMAYQVFHQLARDCELSGDYERAIAFAESSIRLDPWREEVHRLVMRCLYFSGQRSAAIAQYEACCHSIEADLGLQPGPETKQLYQKIVEDSLPQPPSPPAFFQPSVRARMVRAPFVAREEPLERLHSAMEKALGGKGQLLLVSGGAGQGKTALVQEFIHQALDEHSALAAAWGNGHAYFGSGDPFLPFREILEMLSGQVEHRWEAGSITHEHARRMWRLTVPCAQALIRQGPALIGTMISGNDLLQRVSRLVQNQPAWLSSLARAVEGGEPGRPPTQEDLFQQYSRVLAAIAQQVPLLLFVDDLQWVDQSSLGLLFHLFRQLSHSRILVVGAFRPIEEVSNIDVPSPSLRDLINEMRLRHGDILINLDALTDRQFIDAFLDTEPNQLGEAFREKLFDYTHSHPLYTIEMLIGMQERGDLVKNRAGEWVTSETLNWEHLPARVDAAIEERLSHLPQEFQEVLKTASIEGERFTAEVIAKVQGIDEANLLKLLQEELDRNYRLVRGESSRFVGGNRISRYRFRHILFQRYLYSQLDVVKRAKMHERVGEAMEERYKAVLEDISVPLGFHFELAGLTHKAIHYLDLAGKRAIRFSSYEEAIVHFKKALALLEGQPETKDRNQKELELMINMSGPLMLVRGYASEDMQILTDRMAALLKRIPVDVEMFPIFHAISAYYGMRAQYDKVFEVLRGGELIAKRSEKELLIRIVNWGYGFNSLWLGKLEEALSNLNKMVDFYDPDVHSEFRQSYGTDAGVASRLWSSWALWLLGYPEQALNRGQQAIDLSNAIDDPGNQQFALDIVLFLRFLIGEMAGTRELLDALGCLVEKSPLSIHCADYQFLQGLYRLQSDEVEAGIQLMSQGIEAFQACGTRSQLSIRMTLLAEAYFTNDHFDQANKLIQNVEDFIEETGERFYHTEVLCLKGRLLLVEGDPQGAEAYFLKALKVAKGQCAKTLELRAAMSLARLWGNQGRIEDAYEVLAGVYSWFTEGFNTPDLQEAQTLLETLIVK